MDIRFTAAKIVNGWLCLKVENLPLAAEFVSKIKDIVYTAVIRGNRRSLTANAYAWKLMGKLSSAVNKPLKDVYRELVLNVGDNFEVLAMQTDAVPDFKRRWESNGIGWQVVYMGAHALRGYDEIAAYYGSSVYDTRQMSDLIELIVQECREQNIETLPPHKINRMLEDWDAQTNKSTGD